MGVLDQIRKLSPGTSPSRIRFGGAFIIVVLATLMRALLHPLLGTEFPFHPYVIGIGLAAYSWGLTPAITATVLSLLVGRYFFVQPLFSLSIPGPPFIVRVIGFLVYSAGVIAITIVFRTARDRADAARREAEAAEVRTNSILDSISDGFAVLDPELRFHYVNPRLAELCRRPASDLLGHQLWEILPDLKHTQVAVALEKAASARKQAHFEDRYEALDLWFEGEVYPAPEGLTLFVRDITARKKAELELRRKSEQLQRSNAELEQFAYAAAHDLQEPLRSISTSAQLLAERSSDRFEDAELDALRVIVGGAGRMRSLIQDLLTYSRAVSRQPIRFDPVNLGIVAEMAVMNCRPAIDEAGTEIEIRPLPTVLGNEMLLAQVFQNLISNAVKYRRSGIIPRVVISCRNSGQQCEIRVEDNGIGIDMQYADRVFGVFKRLHGPEIPGTGIGLAICKRIVENLGGQIWVESRVGEGSTFCFTLSAVDHT